MKQSSLLAVDVAAIEAMLRLPEVAERFWLRVDKNGPIPSHRPELGPCWIWTGAMSGGYGNFGIWIPELGRAKSLIAHRAAWALIHGNWPSVLLMHACDNGQCVRHISEGTPKANTGDMDAKGRRGKGYRKVTGIGSAHGRAKLTEAIVVTARQRAAAGESATVLAREYGVTTAAVRFAVERKTWRHVE